MRFQTAVVRKTLGPKFLSPDWTLGYCTVSSIRHGYDNLLSLFHCRHGIFATIFSTVVYSPRSNRQLNKYSPASHTKPRTEHFKFASSSGQLFFEGQNMRYSRRFVHFGLNSCRNKEKIPSISHFQWEVPGYFTVASIRHGDGNLPSLFHCRYRICRKFCYCPVCSSK